MEAPQGREGKKVKLSHEDTWFSRRLAELIHKRSDLYHELERLQTEKNKGKTGPTIKFVFQSIQWQLRDLNKAIATYSLISKTVFFEAFYEEARGFMPAEMFKDACEQAEAKANRLREQVSGMTFITDKPTQGLVKAQLSKGERGEPTEGGERPSTNKHP